MESNEFSNYTSEMAPSSHIKENGKNKADRPKKKVLKLPEILPCSYEGQVYKRKLEGSNEEWVWHSHLQKIKIISHLMILGKSSGRLSTLDLRGAKVDQVFPNIELHPVSLELVQGELAAAHLWFGFETFQEGTDFVMACRNAARSVRLSEFKPLSMIGRGKWGKVFVVRRRKKSVPFSAPSPAGSPSKNCRSTLSTSTSLMAAEDPLFALKEIEVVPDSLVHIQNERQVLEVLARAKEPSPFIVRMRWALQKGNFLYIAMDFKTGGDLYTALNRYHLSPEGIQIYVAECLLALEHLHNHRIVYRDLKPENVLLQSDGHLCLGDLGLAKQIKSNDGGWGYTRTLCGTEGYVPPEMLAKASYGPSVDLWQFACFVFELFTGHSPFYSQGQTRSEIRANTAMGLYAMSNELTSRAQSLVHDILRVKVKDRLGYTSVGFDWDVIRSHKYFGGLDWQMCAAGRLRAPFGGRKHRQRHFMDNFEKEFTTQPATFGSHHSPLVSKYEDALKGFEFCDPTFYANSPIRCLSQNTLGRTKSTPLPVQKPGTKNNAKGRGGSLPPCTQAWDSALKIHSPSPLPKASRNASSSRHLSSARVGSHLSSVNTKTKKKSSNARDKPPAPPKSYARAWDGVESDTDLFFNSLSSAKSIVSDSSSISPLPLKQNGDSLNASSDLPVLPSIFWR